MRERARQFWANDEGATAIEYGLIAALICVAIISALTLLGGNMGQTFRSLAATVKTPAP